ncbi:MucR family transcriptional regulator [Methylobacterium sp. J-070]|uniref:MucR family transcriptional regulator n=1 Tax=Methylobacterium sp. J-070 TaxID=2836650 RepID=UPI001FBC09A2|nr:MucR family transcriptional regulator [Methylobacterium sp. J-070]MCJ2051239.1 MucR family transcriptional regulator [Methylobacterium sp. J-070]
MNESTSSPVSDQTDFIELTASLVAAYVSNNSVRPADLPALLAEVHAAIAGLNSGSASAEPKVEKLTPAQIRKSITPDALISFLDGKPYKTLKRHLTGNGLTIEQYRERFGLPRDYPTTAASYSAMRAAFARSNGLGQNKAAAKTANTAETITEVPKARGRKKAAEPAATPSEKPATARKSKKAAAAE